MQMITRKEVLQVQHNTTVSQLWVGDQLLTQKDSKIESLPFSDLDSVPQSLRTLQGDGQNHKHLH